MSSLLRWQSTQWVNPLNFGILHNAHAGTCPDNTYPLMTTNIPVNFQKVKEKNLFFDKIIIK